MKTFFITGGAGFIGGNFILNLMKSSEAKVVNYDKLTYAGNLDTLSSIENDPNYKFINGDILIEQLLLNMGKLGAADVTGIIKSNKKFSNFKFENNIFVDNLKRFYNKFGIFNKQNISSNVFISGNFDLVNLRLRLNEISDDKKFKDEDVNYIEREFNDLVLEDGYASLFNFIKLKEFLKLIATETN